MRPRHRSLPPFAPRASKTPPATGADLKSLADAANEAAKREATQWFFFVTIMITLAAIVGSTTHRILFLEEPVRVPILAVELPLLDFYVAAPAIFLVLHFYLLAQVRLMAGKVNAFLDAAEEQGGPAGLRDAVRRLDPFSVAQLLAAQRLREGRLVPRLVVWVTLAVAPVLLLLFVQVRFLPYHDVAITWWHRIVLVADLVMLWWLWPRARSAWRWRAVPGVALGALASTAVLFFAGVLATISQESADGWAAALPGSLAPEMRRALFDGEVDAVAQRPSSLFSRRLVLPDQTLISEGDLQAFRAGPPQALANIARTTVLRRRDLRDAVLDRADLRRADLTGAQLGAASLADAKLQGATLVGAQMQRAFLDGAQMQGATLVSAQMQRASLAGAKLLGASLDHAQLEGALLDGAQMREVSLRSANLRGASLRGAVFEGATFEDADLQGAKLDHARLQRARLFYTQLQGASLREADLRGASLVAAQLQGASLVFARLEGASLAGAELQGSSLYRARLTGALLTNASLQGVDLDKAVLDGVWLSGSSGWRLRGVPASEAAADRTDVRFDPCRRPSFPFGTCSTDESWADAIEGWLGKIPEGAARDEARDRLAVLTAPPPDPNDSIELQRRWTAIARLDGREIAARLREMACDAEAAPHVARSILHQIAEPSPRGRDLGNARMTLARSMARKNCVGAMGLDEQERARLAEIAVSRESIAPRRPSSEGLY